MPSRPQLAVECLYKILNEGKVRTIITDVTMAAAGIRKGALERMGIGVKCYLGDERAAALAKEKGITEVVFDRGGFIYQGKIAALAEAAREAGLEF